MCSMQRTDRVWIAHAEHGRHEGEHEPQQVVRIALGLGCVAVQCEPARVVSGDNRRGIYIVCLL